MRIAILLLVAALAHADSIEFKNGVRINGEILGITREKVTIQMEEATAAFDTKDLDPFCFYRLYAAFVPQDGQAHLELAVYLAGEKAYEPARKEFLKAVIFDEQLAAEIDAKLKEINDAEAKGLFEEGAAAALAERFEEALARFQQVLQRFPESPFAEESKKAMSAAADAIQKKNAEKQALLAQLAAKKVEDKNQQGEALLKAKADAAAKGLEDGKKLNADALEQEGKGKLTRADRAYQAAATRLVEAKTLFLEVQSGSKDDALLAQAKEKLPEVDKWLIGVYDNLGHMWATQQNFREAQVWLNRALAIDPTDKVATELKLRIAEELMRLQQPRQPPR